MRSLPRLTSLFRSITSLAAVSGAVAACGDTDGRVSRSGLDETACTNGAYVPHAGLTPKVAVDYINTTGSASNTGIGTPCATATDVPACTKKLEALQPQGGLPCGEGGCSLIVFTRGDEVGSLASLADIKSFLAFGSVNDAALVAWANGHQVVCSENNANTTASGFELLTHTGSTCGGNIYEHRVVVSKAGDFTVEETSTFKEGEKNCSIGRRPEGFALLASPTSRGLGAWFAEVAQLEAASVFAFERLAEELAALGASADLVRLAHESAADEVRHARVTATLARRHGGVVEAASVAALPPRGLFEVALENAVEGCVRETFGALLATYQEGHAESADVRAAMRVIATDETKHSALAWEIAAWADSLLSTTERTAIAEARSAAVAKLRSALHEEPDAEVQRLAGMPDAKMALRMFDVAAAELWAA